MDYIKTAVMKSKSTHITVLTDEAVEALAITDTSVVVDATIGSSGHARHIISKLGAKAIFVGIDADQDAIAQGEKELARGKEFHSRHSQVKKIFDYFYKRIGVGVQFVVPYAIDRGESLAGGGFDRGHVS